ncbi:uncharacterized protein [Dendrobates tinctorius]|uniref:uncharacterized protein n=1 Tax=Dendrobates tinctorius TaxID=92724 RepID=UPI003CC94696
MEPPPGSCSSPPGPRPVPPPRKGSMERRPLSPHMGAWGAAGDGSVRGSQPGSPEKATVTQRVLIVMQSHGGPQQAAEPDRGASHPAEPGRGASHPAEPGRGASHPAEPGRGASHPAEPDRGASHPAEPGRGASHPAEPDRGASHPAEPGRGASHPAEPGRGASHPAEPGRGASHPAEPRRGASHPAEPGHGASHPAGPDRGASHPAGPDRGASHPAEPGRGASHPAEPGRGASHPAEPGRGASHPAEPGRGASHPAGPGRGASHPAEPGRGASHPAEPGRGASHPAEPGRGASHPAGPGRGASHPAEPGRGASHPAGPGRGASHPAEPGRGASHPAGPGRGASHPAEPGRGASHPAEPGRGASHPAEPGRGASHPAGPGRGASHPAEPGRGVSHPAEPGRGGSFSVEHNYGASNLVYTLRNLGVSPRTSKWEQETSPSESIPTTSVSQPTPIAPGQDQSAPPPPIAPWQERSSAPTQSAPGWVQREHTLDTLITNARKCIQAPVNGTPEEKHGVQPSHAIIQAWGASSPPMQNQLIAAECCSAQDTESGGSSPLPDMFRHGLMALPNFTGAQDCATSHEEGTPLQANMSAVGDVADDASQSTTLSHLKNTTISIQTFYPEDIMLCATRPDVTRRAPSTGPDVTQSAPSAGPEVTQSAPSAGPEVTQSAPSAGPEVTQSAPSAGPEVTQSAPSAGPGVTQSAPSAGPGVTQSAPSAGPGVTQSAPSAGPGVTQSAPSAGPGVTQSAPSAGPGVTQSAPSAGPGVTQSITIISPSSIKQEAQQRQEGGAAMGNSNYTSQNPMSSLPVQSSLGRPSLSPIRVPDPSSPHRNMSSKPPLPIPSRSNLYPGHPPREQDNSASHETVSLASFKSKTPAPDTLSYLDSVSLMSGTMESLTLLDDASSLGSDSEINGMPYRKTDKYGFLGGNQFSGNSETAIPVEIARQRELKWLDMFSNWDKWLTRRFQKVKLRCRKGIPSSLRAKAWQYLSNSHELLIKNPGKFEEMERQQGDPKWLDVIEKDLHRQFPFHEMFAARGGHGQQDLYRILKAYTVYRPEEGYCQAQAPVAAVLLMHMPAEQAFWCLVQICDKYLPGYYSAGLEAIQLDGEIFFALLRRICPMAYRHLKKFKIDPILYMTEWFMCIFSRTLPWVSVLRVWDMFFCEGVKIVFRVGLVLLRHTLGSVDKLRSCQGMYETMEKLRSLPVYCMQEEVLLPEVSSLPVTDSLIERESNTQLRKWRENRGELQYRSSRRLHGARQIHEEKLRLNPTLSGSRLSLSSIRRPSPPATPAPAAQPESLVVSEGLRPALPSPTSNKAPLGPPKDATKKGKEKPEKKREKEEREQEKKREKEEREERKKEREREKQKEKEEKRVQKEREKAESRQKKERKFSFRRKESSATDSPRNSGSGATDCSAAHDTYF